MSEHINYTKEAFMSPWNLAFLLVAMLLALFTIDTGLADFILIFAAAAELLFLGTVPRQERFRRVVKSRRAAEHNKPPSEREVFRGLTKQSQKRYIRLRNLEKAIAVNYEKLGYASQGLLESHLDKIDGLLDSYMGLLHTKERYEIFTQRSADNEVATAISQLQKEMETDNPRVRKIKERRLRILEKRLDKFKKAHENLEIIEAQMETIEDVTAYIHEQSLTMRNPEEISFQLDTLLTEVEETQHAVEEIEEVFARPTDLLGDLDTFDPESDLSARPRTGLRE